MTAGSGWIEEALREHSREHSQDHDHGERPGGRGGRRRRVREERITMSHGAGGKATQTLIEAVFLDAFRNPLLEPLEDAASLSVAGARLGGGGAARADH